MSLGWQNNNGKQGCACVCAQGLSYHNTNNSKPLFFELITDTLLPIFRISKKVVVWYYSLPYSTKYWKGSCEKPSCTAPVLGKYGQIGYVFETLKHC